MRRRAETEKREREEQERRQRLEEEERRMALERPGPSRRMDSVLQTGTPRIEWIFVGYNYALWTVMPFGRSK